MGFWSWFFLLLIFIPLLLVYAMTIWNIFTRPGMPGLHRALWLVVVVVFPFVGTLVYLVIHGNNIGAQRGMERRAEDIGTGRAPV